MFLHGGWLHVIGNMWMLWIFGDNVEDRMGPLRFIAFYLICGVIAAVVHVATNSGSQFPTVGASGALAGVLGAYFLMFPASRVIVLLPVLFIPLFFELPAVIYLGLWFMIQFLSGTASVAAGSEAAAGGIAWWAHIGGFLAGILLYRLFLTR
jgi:membrane associated rhomboid family serine protease